MGDSFTHIRSAHQEFQALPYKGSTAQFSQFLALTLHGTMVPKHKPDCSGDCRETGVCLRGQFVVVSKT